MEDPPPHVGSPPSRLVLTSSFQPPPPHSRVLSCISKSLPPLWDVICLVACPEKHAKPGMENMCVNICLICLSLPVVHVVAMSFFLREFEFH